MARYLVAQRVIYHPFRMQKKKPKRAKTKQNKKQGRQSLVDFFSHRPVRGNKAEVTPYWAKSGGEKWRR